MQGCPTVLQWATRVKIVISGINRDKWNKSVPKLLCNFHDIHDKCGRVTQPEGPRAGHPWYNA